MQQVEKEKIKNELADLYYEVMAKQIQPFPHNGLFHKVDEKEINEYWFPIISKIERLCRIVFDKDIKLRYANSVFVLKDRTEFIKNFKEGAEK